MRHYEVVFIVHPDQSDQVPSMVGRYRTMIIDQGGLVHNMEDWGRRQMVYPIQKMVKAHYFCMNIQCDNSTLDELQYSLRYNDAILRYLFIKTKKARTVQSKMVLSPGIETESSEKASQVEQ